MTRLATLLVCLALQVPQAPQDVPGPVLRVLSGAARLQQGERLRELDPSSGSTPLAGRGEFLEAAALSELELVWRGRASATLSGPAALVLEREPRLTLERFQRVELEVRRGTLELVVASLGTLTLGTGVLGLQSLPGGVLELRNRGAGSLELGREQGPPLVIAPGKSVRLRGTV